MENYYKRASDLDNEEKNKINNYFYAAGDLDSKKEEKFENINEVTMMNTRDIEIYLNNIVSGEKYESDTICAEGNSIVSFARLQEMVESGDYNIVKANYFNNEMIEIFFQKFERNISRHM